MKKRNIQKEFSGKKSGFTLIEMMVALSIFSFSVLAVLVLLGTSISNVGYAEKKMTASYLAEEGIEFMRNMRDTFVLYDPDGAQKGWEKFNTSLNQCIFTNNNPNNPDKKCYFDNQGMFSSSTPIVYIDYSSCSVPPYNGICPIMHYDPNSGYGYTSGTATDYIRDVFVQEITPDEIRIFSTVHWKQKSADFSVTFSEDLFNWVQ